MKSRFFVFLLSGLVLQNLTTRAGDKIFWVKLSGHRIMHEVAIRSVGDDTLNVLTQSRMIALPLSSVEQIRLLRESEMLNDAVVGAAIGIGVGALLGLTVENNGESSAPWLRAGLLGGLLGAVAGSVIGGFEKEGMVILTGLSNADKKHALLRLLEE
ncbi:MAG: hypothetical protein HYZ01_13915 [Ignavibacteriales bacterium]|nr:hypothetical protein [Ignavibacteriales bacterium]